MDDVDYVPGGFIILYPPYQLFSLSSSSFIQLT